MKSTDTKESVDIRKISFLPKDQEYLIRLIGAKTYKNYWMPVVSGICYLILMLVF